VGGKCLVVEGNRAYNGAKVQIWDCNSVAGPYRSWVVGNSAHPSPSPRPPGSLSCEQACFFKGEQHTCRDRVNWLLGQGQNHWQAIGTVNSDCQGQCSCSDGDFANPTPPPSPPTPATPPPTSSSGSLSCDQACFFRGEMHTCRDRVNWLLGQGLSQSQAITTVSSDCINQCSCSAGDFGNPTPPPTPNWQCASGNRYEDCGYWGITQLECESRGCCYTEHIGNGQKKCFPRSGSNPTPPPPTPPPTSGSGTRYFQFRVKNSFSPFVSNADKALSAARRAAGSLGVGIEWSDDTDNSVSWTHFLFKVGLSTPVNRDAYINAFESACRAEDLQWGSSGDIFEDNTCISEGQVCPQDWDCHSRGYPGNLKCPDVCCGALTCVTDRLGQNPGVCKSR
jgi:hypothetical protein